VAGSGRTGRSPAPGLTLAVPYLRLVAEVLRRAAVPVGEWLALSGLSESRLAGPALAVSFPVFRRLVLDGLALAGEPALGLLVGERLVASTHGIVGYAVLNSGTLRAALEILERFAGLRTSLVAIAHVTRQVELRIRLSETRPLDDIRRPLLEAVALSVKNVLDVISMGAAHVHAAAFPFAAPEHAALARELFRCEVRYRQAWCGLALAPELLDEPLRLGDPAAFEEAARICQGELDKLAANESLAGRVRRILLERQPGFASLPATARLLHMTPRTLHRRLVDEGTSYRELLEGVRHALAVEHLRARRLAIEEIAYLLGYTDPANFRRAFKRWTSLSPAAFRARSRS